MACGVPLRYPHAMNNGARDRADGGAARAPRTWVSVYFRCCNIYQRVYFARGSVSAVGRCPSCLREIQFRLDADADPGRFFTAEE